MVGALVFVALLGAFLVYYATPFMGVATVAYGLMVLGLLLRRRRLAHMRLMSAAMALDVSVVLILELQRDAIATALSFSLSPLQQAHIAMSALATVLYFPTIMLGLLRYRGRIGVAARSWHIRCGLAAFGFRSLGFILMFSLLWKN